MNPQVFGKEHLIYIAVSLVLGILIPVLAKKVATNERRATLIIKASALILFIIIFANRLVLVFEFETVNWCKLIPDSFCSASSYALSLALLFGKKDNNVLHFIWLVALAGGVITTFYPDFIGQNPSFLYPSTILGMIHHTWSALVIILLFMFKYLNLTYKKWYCVPIGFTCYLSLGAYLLCVLDYGNPFYMTGPALKGTPFTVWGIAPIFIAVYAIIVGSVELARYISRKK